jgi:hypothetical protein
MQACATGFVLEDRRPLIAGSAARRLAAGSSASGGSPVSNGIPNGIPRMRDAESAESSYGFFSVRPASPRNARDEMNPAMQTPSHSKRDRVGI